MAKPDGWQQLPQPVFGGLNLRDQPGAVDGSQAIDSHDVIHTERGRIAQRDGWVEFSDEVDGQVLGLGSAVTTAGTRRLLVSTDDTATAIGTDGVALTSGHVLTGLTAALKTFCRFGGPTAEVVYAGNGSDELVKYDVTGGWTTPGHTIIDGVSGSTTTGQDGPRGKLVAVWPGEERLVVAGFPAGISNYGPGGEGSGVSHVWFSEPGQPESWTDTSFARLTPGDGERITAMCGWRELFFVFKETKFFVFTNINVDSEGTPEFVRRPIAAGVGAVGPEAVCVGRDGVYFATRTGIYRTQGEEPELMTAVMEPLWSNRRVAFYSSGYIAQASLEDVALCWHEELVYMSFASDQSEAGHDRVLVMDPRYGWHTIWRVAAGSMHVFRAGNRDELYFAHGQDARIGRLERGQSTDDGGDMIPGYYRSGYDVLARDRVVRLTGCTLWGSGALYVSQTTDFRGEEWSRLATFGAGGDTWGGGDGLDTWGDGSDPDDVWGPAAAVQSVVVRRAIRGAHAGWIFRTAQAGTTWTVSRAVRHAAGVRGALPATGAMR
jgi:hypothetical protein